jgi:uncharacterized membrane protein YraQ (UPF0718 family)
MTEKRSIKPMLIPTMIMGIIALTLFIIAYSRGEGEHLIGLRLTLNMIVQILPMLFCAFIVAGMIQILIPQEVISKWVGSESGIRGIIMGTVAGGVSPGGPYISLPIVAGLLRSGASIGTMVAFLTGWSLWAIARMPMDIGILGWKFTAIRFGVTFLFPIIAGMIAQALFANVKL